MAIVASVLGLLLAGGILAFGVWRLFFFGRGVGLTSNWGMQKGDLSHSHHFFRITFAEGIDILEQCNLLFDDLATFRSFDSGNNDVALKYTKTAEDGRIIVYFDSTLLLRLCSILFNWRKVPVRVLIDHDTLTVIGDTLGMHMLVGQRRWQLKRLGPRTIVVRTASYDYGRGKMNALAMRYFGKWLQLRVWTGYFLNIADDYRKSVNAVSSHICTKHVCPVRIAFPWPIAP